MRSGKRKKRSEVSGGGGEGKDGQRWDTPTLASFCYCYY